MKNKTNHWSFIGYMIGTTFSIFSGIRYFVLWPDLDKALVYVLLGLIICGLSWLYDKQKKQGDTLEAIEEYLADQSNKKNGFK